MSFDEVSGEQLDCYRRSWRVASVPLVDYQEHFADFSRELIFRSFSSLVGDPSSTNPVSLSRAMIDCLVGCSVGVVAIVPGWESQPFTMSGIIISPSKILLSGHFGKMTQVGKRDRDWLRELRLLELHFFLDQSTRYDISVLVDYAEIPTEVNVMEQEDRIVVRLPLEDVIRGLRQEKEIYPINILQLPDAVLENGRLRSFLETRFALIGCPDLEVLGNIHSDVTEVVPVVATGKTVKFETFHMFEEFPLIGAGIWDRFEPDYRICDTPRSLLCLLYQIWDNERARKWFLGVLELSDERRMGIASRLREVNKRHRLRVGSILRFLRTPAIPGLEVPWSPEEFLFSAGLCRSLFDEDSIVKRFNEIWVSDQMIIEAQDEKDFPLLAFLLKARSRLLHPDEAQVERLERLFEQARHAALVYWFEVRDVLRSFATARSLDKGLGYRPKRNLCLSEGLLGFSGGVDVTESGVDLETLQNAELHHADVLNVVGFSGGPVVSFRCLKDLEIAVVVGVFQSVQHTKLVGTKLRQFCRQLAPLRGAHKEVFRYFQTTEDDRRKNFFLKHIWHVWIEEEKGVE